ncbi:MAG: hypothetical protein S4CHLAM6_07940 [Chlamydiae bacterium]|nr:hypothetical protein [Chlamydiota bacterium]
MGFEIYLKNIKKLAQSFGSTQAIELDEVLGVTFICNHQNPIMLNINYDLSENTLIIDTLLATNMPSSRLGIQTIMNQLIGDLLTQKRSIGKLIAIPEDMAVKYEKRVNLNDEKGFDLAQFIPIFIDEALNWRRKFKEVSSKNKAELTSKPKEVVSFQYP